MLINRTKNIVLAEKVYFLTSFFQKAIGLMFKRKIDGAYLFLFDEDVKYSVHTFFVFHRLDLIFLNKEWEVIEIFKNVKPFDIIFPEKSYRILVELPAGWSKNTEIGDKLEVQRRECHHNSAQCKVIIL